MRYSMGRFLTVISLPTLCFSLVVTAQAGSNSTTAPYFNTTTAIETLPPTNSTTVASLSNSVVVTTDATSTSSSSFDISSKITLVSSDEPQSTEISTKDSLTSSLTVNLNGTLTTSSTISTSIAGDTSIGLSSTVAPVESTVSGSSNGTLPESTTGSSIGSSTVSSIQNSSETPVSSSTEQSTDSLTITTSDSLTGTITSLPSDFTGTTLSGTSYSVNDWITTTDGDSHTTLLPIVVIGGGRAVAFWDLPTIPEVEFSLPGLPKFHLPCIRFFGASIGDCPSPPETDSDETPTSSQSTDPTSTESQLSSSSSSSPSSSSSSASSCTASNTVSNCVVSCVSTVSSSSCASYTTTCSETSTGCSVQGTTSTVSGTGSCMATPASSFAQATQTFCSAGCKPTSSPGTQVVSPTTAAADPTGADYRKRAIAGRVTMDPLVKRGASSAISTLGGCGLSTPAAQPLTRPGWPSVYSDMLNAERAGNMAQEYSVISRYDRATTSGCVRTITRLSANDFANAPNDWIELVENEKVQKVNKDASLDHAYEKNWLDLFFQQIISSSSTSTALTCDETNQYFFPTSSTSSCTYNLLQAVWDSLASTTNLDFIAMSQYLNGNAKSKFFPDKLDQSFEQRYTDDPDYLIASSFAKYEWSTTDAQTAGKYSAYDTIYGMLQYWEQVLYGVLVMKSDNMLDLIDRTNNRIYGELQNVDLTIESNPGNVFGDTTAYSSKFPNGIAGAYKDFMTSTIQSQINIPSTYLSNLWLNYIGPGLTASWYFSGVMPNADNPDEPQPYTNDYWALYNLIMAQNDHYRVGETGTYSWEYSFKFSWDVTNFEKRDVSDLVRRQDSCPVLSTHSSAASTASSLSASASLSLSVSSTVGASSISTDSTSISSAVSSSTSSSVNTTDTSTESIISSTSSASDSSSATITTSLSAPTTIDACSFVTTVYPSTDIVTGTQRFCQCGETMAGIQMATSGTSTTTYCATGGSLPTGYVVIPVINGIPVTSATTAAPSVTSAPTTSSAATSTVAATSALPTCKLWTDCPADTCASADDSISCTNGQCACWTNVD